jgi:hypothetical protein
MVTRPDGDFEGLFRESELPLAEAFKAAASTRSQTIERGNPCSVRSC